MDTYYYQCKKCITLIQSEKQPNTSYCPQVHLVQISKYKDIKTSLVQIHHHLPLIQSIRNADLDEAAALIFDHIKDFYHLDSYVMKCYTRFEQSASADIPALKSAQS